MKDGEKIGGQACLHQGQGRHAVQFRQRDEENACRCVSVSNSQKLFPFLASDLFFFFPFIHSHYFSSHRTLFRISIPKSKHPFTPTTSPPITYILTSQHTITTGRNTLKQWETIQKHSPSASESLVSDTHSCSPRSQQRSSSTR